MTFSIKDCSENTGDNRFIFHIHSSIYSQMREWKGWERRGKDSVTSLLKEILQRNGLTC